MSKKIPYKGRALRSLTTPLNASLITNARKKSPRKSPFRKAKKTRSEDFGGTLCFDKAENSSTSGSWEETQAGAASTASEEHDVTTTAEAAEPSPRLQSKQERSKENSEVTVKKNKNTKSKSYGGMLGSDKAENSRRFGFRGKTRAASISLEEHNVTKPEQDVESVPQLQSKRERRKESNSELILRKIEEVLKSGNERHPDAAFGVHQNEAELPKINKQTNGEDSNREELSNQSNSLNEKPNQPKCSTDKNCNLSLVVCTANSVTKNNVSTNFRNNKRLDRTLNSHDESLFKLSKATKLTGTINKERRNIERQLEKNLRNVTIRRKCHKPAIESSNETIRIDEKKENISANLTRKRKKMPDFSAIHQQNFDKMESIVDHLDRKARRAIVLTTSTVKKAKPNMKRESTEKKSVVGRHGRKAQRTLLLTPSATRKVSLDMTESSSKKASKSTYFAVRQQANSKSETPTSKKDVKLKCAQKLDITFDNTQLDNKSSQENTNILHKSDTKFDKINDKKKATQENVNILPKVDTKFDQINAKKQVTQENVNILPKVDTEFDKINAKKQVTQENVNILPKVVVSKAKVEELNSRILEKRGLYKGKIEAGGGGIRQKKNMEILRGVRSNRRFELQMKYRNSQN